MSNLIGESVKTAYGPGTVISVNSTTEMYEIQLDYGRAYIKFENLAPTPVGQDVLIWHLPHGFKISQVWNLLGKKYPVNTQRTRIVSIKVPTEEEADELCRRFNNTKFGGSYVGLRFDEPRNKKRARKKKTNRRPLRLVMSPAGYGRIMERKKQFNFVKTQDGGVKIFKRDQCQEIYYASTQNDQAGYVKTLHPNGLAELQTELGTVTISYKELTPVTTVSSMYGSGEVKNVRRAKHLKTGEIAEVALDFGTLYADPESLKAVMSKKETEANLDVKETGI